MRSKLSASLLVTFVTLGLSACGGSSGGGSDFPDAYIQFYNGSSNSALTYMREIDEGTLGSASFGDATSMITHDNGDIDLEFYRFDSNDQEVLIEEATYRLRIGDKTLVIMSGDFEAPTFTEYSYDRDELEDHFRLFAIGLVTDQSSYDIHMSESGSPFVEANLLGTVTYNGFEELEYWDGDSDSEDFDEGDYTIFLTEPGSTDVIFESPTLSFNFATEYVLAIRSTAGAVQNEVEIDVILNSSAVSNIADIDASSQYRIYNSLDGDQTLQVDLESNDDVSESISLAANTLTEFSEITFGDYRLSAENADSSLSFNNRLVTLNQGESKAIVIYEDEGQLTSLSFEESDLPQVFDKQIQAANLVPDFVDVDLYFVRSDETIESAEFLIASIDFGESKSVTIPSDFYQIVAVFDDNEDTQVLLDRTALIGITAEENYIITIEKTDDSPTGYAISLLF